MEKEGPRTSVDPSIEQLAEEEVTGSRWIFFVLLLGALISASATIYSFLMLYLIGILPLFLTFIFLVLLASSYYTVREWERVVLLRWGRIRGVVSPGLRFKIPGIEKIIIRDMRTSALDVADQEVITKDNISVTIDAVVFLRIVDPGTNVKRISEYRAAIAAYSNTTLRNVVGKMELDDLLAEREKVAEDIKKLVDEVAADWGVDIERVELTDIRLPEGMKRIMARQAEAEREKRGVVIKAQGELEAASKLAKAAQTLRTQPGALELRRLSTISDVSQDQSNTIIFAVPLEYLAPTMSAAALAEVEAQKALKKQKKVSE